MKRLLLLSAFVLLAAACQHSATMKGPMAMAMVTPTSGSKTIGTVHFQQLGDGSVEVKADLTGVPPGVHGFHVHDKGACEDNGNAAGGHFNPTGAPHAAPSADHHHAGDFGNVTADANGEVHSTFTTRAITVADTAESVVGHAVILHAKEDDLTTQPSGNAGARIGCGVIQKMAESMHP
jgi:Cu-Zn family superoxide dismutase